MGKRETSGPRNVAATVACVFVLSLAAQVPAADTSKPPLKAGDKPGTSAPGGNRPTGGGSPPPPGGGGTKDPGLFSDVAGASAPLVYCRAGEPCEVVRHFHNRAAAATGAIPSPAWMVNDKAMAPASVEPAGGGSGWPAGETRKWTARFTLAKGDYHIRAVMPRLANEKEDGNNVAPGRVIVGEPDMSVKLERDNVDFDTRYEIKVEIENKGTVPTRGLSMIAVLSVNTHTGTPPTLDQCFANPGLSGCVMERHSVDKLDPGQKKRWKIGGKQLVTTSVVGHAVVACREAGPCADSNPGNNSAKKTFGP